MPREEKSKFEFEEKKVQFITESCIFKAEMPANFTLFRIQILIFLRETTQNDHIRLLYKFETEQKNLNVLGVVDMRQLLLKAYGI